MVIDAKEYIGKKMDWTEIERLFPDCYVALDDYYTDGHKTNGILCYVCTTQGEMIEELKKQAALLDTGAYRCMRLSSIDMF